MSHAGNARLVRRTKIALIVMVLTSPLAIWGTVRGLNELNDDALGWTTSDLPARQDLAWFMRGLDKGLSRHAAVLDAYRRSAPAMVRTTAICGAGLAVYGVSSFLPAARFGWIVGVLLLRALVGDLLLLPALLTGRMGRILFPRRKQVSVST